MRTEPITLRHAIIALMDADTADGVTLWWELSGSGPVIVLVPGRGDSSDLYPSMFSERLLDAGFSVLRFDPRDTGRSGDGGGTYSLSTMADDVITVLDDAGVEAAHLIGVSMGGMLLIDLGSRHPSRVLSETFVSAMSPDPDAGFGDDFFASFGADPVDAGLRAMGSPTDGDREWLIEGLARAELRAPTRPAAAERHQEAAFRGDWLSQDRLADISVPALVIHGTDDRVLPVGHALALDRGIARSTLHLTEGMGHLPTPREWTLIGDLVVDHCHETSER